MVEHSLYDWGKDYGIPLLGAIAVPMLVWWLTWFYGAGRAEKQKELEKLRDNLNFLVSVSLASLNTLIFLGNKIKEVLEKEASAKHVICNNLPSLDASFDDICYGFLFDNVFDVVDETKYAPCIEHNKDFVVDIVRVKSLLNAAEQYITHRNNTIASIANCENLEIKLQRCNAFLLEDYVNFDKYLIDVYRITILLKQIIDSVEKLNISIRELNLLSQPYSTAYWKQGYSSEKSFIYTTTFSMQEASLERLHEEVGDNNLLVCCSAFSGNSKAYPNISVKKIPAAILKKCEWGREGYPLNLTNYHPDDKEFEFDEENDE